MPLSNLLKAAAGTCPFCNQKAGILSCEHPHCRRTFQAGWHEMVDLAADAAGSPGLRRKPPAAHPIRRGEDLLRERGHRQPSTGGRLETGLPHSMADGIITQEEEARLREFRDQLALGSNTADPDAMRHLGKASRDRLMLDARLAAIAVFDGAGHLNGLGESLSTSGLPHPQFTSLISRQGLPARMQPLLITQTPCKSPW